MNINKNKVLFFTSVVGVATASACGISLLPSKGDSNSLAYNNHMTSQKQVVESTVTRDTIGIKSISVSKTPPFAKNNGYIQGTQVVFKLEIIMQDPNEVPPNITSITWTLTSSDGRILDETNGDTFMIDSFAPIYQNCILSISNLSIDGVDPSDKILDIQPITLGKSYIIEIRELDYSTQVKIISLTTILAFIIILAIIAGKIGVSYKMEHTRAH